MNDKKIIIFTAPSGSGKTTVVKHLLATMPEIGFSISATTRPRRANEIDGKDYYFIDKQSFESKISNNEFIEYEEVYQGVFYGTLKSEVERVWSLGKHLILDLDVNGALNLKKIYGDTAIAIFVKVPEVETLEKRLRQRNTESEENLQKRIAKARFELRYEADFDVVLLNEDLQQTLLNAEKIVGKFLDNKLASEKTLLGK